MPLVQLPKPKITLRGDGAQFFLSVRPCPGDLPTLEQFGDYITARTAGRQLGWEHGWSLVDEVPAPIRKAAEAAEERRLEAKRRHG
jgi:hypothetical protein